MPENFTIHDRGQFRPADCLRCGNAGPLVDLGAGNLEGYGRAYLCVLCVQQLCKAMGYAPASDTDREVELLRDALANAVRERDLAVSQRRELEALTSEPAPAALTQPEIKEFLDGITGLVDRLSRDLRNAARGGSDPVPVPADGEDAAPAVGGEREADRAGGDPQPAKRGRAPKRNRGRAGTSDDQPVGAAGRGDDEDGSLERAGAEVDGSDVDASFGWARADDDARDDGAAGDDGPAADE